ncbi:Zinc finger, C2H2 type family protein [Tritrichomonas foetus]|uniref:Zinc finger, C2H2 type family protein n=1 Tax=Tritrichomonas foetus TaxID=1144522 RepID=A0A1J4J731_9EUKA|nr:Zinc finger, C2H2 type family protein [Tritrichomonas foetus]|eukprot:OHS95042.1 Zinc finger, C2H2 type family protein [Tritrichomonas foetus]
MNDNCIICFEKINTRVVLPCGHTSFCLSCFTTMNQCHGKRNCPFCQKEITEDPIITQNQNVVNYFDELQKQQYHHDEIHHFYYNDEKVLKEQDQFNFYKCNHCNYITKNFKKFDHHLHEKHSCVTCRICHSSNGFLPSQTETFHSGKEIQQHLKLHPRCPICKFIGFDHFKISQHMHEKHIRCDICANHDKIQWFATENEYINHCESNHFVCKEISCCQHGPTVFASHFELQMHKISFHNEGNKNIMIDFRESQPAQLEEINDYKEEHRKRMKAAWRKLSSGIGNQSHASKVFDLITQLNKKKIDASSFYQKAKETINEKSELLFCDIVAAISNGNARSDLLRVRQGLNIHQMKPQNMEMNKIPTQTKDSTLEANNSEKKVAIQQKVTQSGKKRGKRIVITSF